MQVAEVSRGAGERPALRDVWGNPAVRVPGLGTQPARAQDQEPNVALPLQRE